MTAGLWCAETAAVAVRRPGARSACSEDPLMSLRFALLAAVASIATVAAASSSTAQTWTPLEASRFAAEFTQPWIGVPDGSSGAPRQGWLGAPDGFFTREVHLAYDWIDADGGEAHRVIARFNYPLSRRLWVGVEAPIYQDLDSGGSGIGDIGVTAQVMLAETRDLSLNAGLGLELPTGDDSVGAGEVFGVTPQVNLWTDLGAGVSFRSRASYAARDEGGADGFGLSLALGQTVTPAEAAPLGQFTYSLAVNWFAPDEGKDVVTVTPALRTRLVDSLFLLIGVELPVSDDEPFDQRWIIQLVRGF